MTFPPFQVFQGLSYLPARNIQQPISWREGIIYDTSCQEVNFARRLSSCPWSDARPTNTRRRLACTRSQFPLWTDFWLLNLLDSAKQDQKADDAENENRTSHQEIRGK